jgi:hypothetical protein
MDPALNHDQLQELLGAFALHAVDPDEAAAVQAHLDVCVRCRDEVTQHRQTAAMMASSGAEAPAELWDAIAARIEEAPTAPREFPGLRRSATGSAARSRSTSRLRSITLRRVAALTAAAAAAIIAVLGVEVGRLNHRLDQVTAASAGQTLSSAARGALLDPSARRITLAGAKPGAVPAAEIVTLRTGTAFLFNEALPALPSVKTYQLWAMIDGQPISVGLLGARPATVAFSLGTAASTNAFAVTIEPAAGSIAPTQPPVASTTL